ETETGLWVVSDTDWIGDRRYQRPRIAFFPYSEGYNTASKSTGALRGSVYVGAPIAGSPVLYRVNAGGAAIASADNGPDWAADNAATSTFHNTRSSIRAHTAAPTPFHNTGSSIATQSALTAANLVNVPASTPLGIWTSERNDPTTSPEMQWTFPVPAGTHPPAHHPRDAGALPGPARHQHPAPALLRQPVVVDAALQRADRRRDQAVE